MIFDELLNSISLQVKKLQATFDLTYGPKLRNFHIEKPQGQVSWKKINALQIILLGVGTCEALLGFVGGGH